MLVKFHLLTPLSKTGSGIREVENLFFFSFPMYEPMKSMWVGLNVLVLCAMLFRLIPIPNASAASPILIGEVAWAGSSLSTSDEWIELWNVGDATTSLAGWSLHGAGESGKVIPFSGDAVIPPYGTLLISNYAASDTKSVLDISPNVVTSTISLSNSALQFTLVDSFGSVIDTAGDSKTPPAGASLPTKMTMIRVLTPNDIAPVGWISATTSAGFKVGTSDLGTPGFCDGCEEPPAIVEADEVGLNEEQTTTSSTDPVIDSATTTEDIVDAVADSTEENNPITLDNSTTTEIIVMSTSTDSDTSPTELIVETATLTSPDLEDETDEITTRVTPTESTMTITATVPPKPAYGMLRLNEIAPYPASDKEWVEITSLDKSQTISLKNCVLHDASGKILTISDITIDPATSPFAVIQLATSKLNNSGDSVALYDPEGRLLDAMTYGAVKKGETWIRKSGGDGSWSKTQTPTPGTENASFMAISTNTTTSTQTVADIATATGEMERSDVSNPTRSTTPTHVSPPSYATSTKNPKFSLSTASEISPPPTTKTTKKTTAPPKPKTATSPKKKSTTPPAPLPITFDMIDQEQSSAIRVRLQGFVGTPPGLLSKHAFVLQSPDGRGLLIQLPTTAKLPEQGISVIVTGSLHFDNRNTPYLQLGAKDQWTKATGTNATDIPTFRPVDVTAPGSEDAWSLMHVTGTVQGIHGSVVHLDLGDAELDILFKPLIGYRVKRLTIGDEVTISGVLDITTDPPKLIPRANTEIAIIGHKAATIVQSATQKNPLSDYAPIGAAAGAIATTEGVKQWHRRRKQRQLERKLTMLQSSSM